MLGFDTCDVRLYAGTEVDINGKTKVFGIIGDPVSHSLSPLFQNRFLEQHGVNAVYVPFRIKTSDISGALNNLWATGIEGFNVTVPHKEAVLRMLEVDADAQCIGAVNTVMRHAAGWRGTNTDWQGFRDVLHGMEIDVGEGEVLLFGAGGTARAVLHALVQEKVAKISVCNRSQDRLQTFIKHANETYPTLAIEVVNWSQEVVRVACKRSVLMVNTTSIGLQNTAEPFPFELPGDCVAVDAVYAQDGHTAFVCAAEKSGHKVIDGLPMLLAQGIASFYYWHQIKPAHISAMHWLEGKLGREPANLPGWGNTV